jgi:transcriptional regulator with XRE-family HTH domain
MKYSAIVGALLRGLRRRRGLTQADVAAPLTIEASTWSRIEAGHVRLSLEHVAVVAQLLALRPSDIAADTIDDVVRSAPAPITAARLRTLAAAS